MADTRHGGSRKANIICKCIAMKIVGKEIIADEGKYLCHKSDTGFNMPFTRGILLHAESEDDFVELDHKPEPIPEPEPTPEPIPDTMIRQVAMFATMAVNSVELSDAQSLRIKSIYPEWEDLIGSDLKAGFKLQYHGILYKTRQEIKPVLEIYPPSVDTASLYEEINETHEGTKEDPIPYNNNMELIMGEYYSQDGVIYLCIRSTGQAVYNDLSDLVSAGYVKVVE